MLQSSRSVRGARLRARSGLVACPAAIFFALAIVAAGLPAAAAQLFHSPGDDGQPPFGPGTIAEGGVRSIFLYIDDGAMASAPGSACHDGQGDEICGYQVTLTGAGGLTIASFAPEPGADLLVDQSAGGIVINGLDPVSPTPGPKRIGELQVNAATGGSLSLTDGEAIGADLGSEILTTGTLVVVPEPRAAVTLASGGLLLAALARRRARRC